MLKKEIKAFSLFSINYNMRINKYIASTGYCSRRQADTYIQNGDVTINGEQAELGSQVHKGDEVYVKGVSVEPEREKVVLMYNKPVGVICTTDTRKKDSIISKVKHHLRIFPIGRLDVQTSGLILLTNNGDLVNILLRPHNHVEKEYFVKVDKKIDSQTLKILESGVDIGDEYKTLPAQVQKRGHKSFTITVTEGRNRIIRRMCDALDLEVVQLRRIRFGALTLGDLEVGKYRTLSKQEIQQLLK